ncbi:MAG: dihydroorotate dehydrogenase electron transfer subunit [Thermoguttaceae bacterium]|nr:dihydroorotate dehydrogenase electron transfer subunit [Thermoguttaceae bacterium]
MEDNLSLSAPRATQSPLCENQRTSPPAFAKFWFGRVPIVDNRAVGRDIYLLRLAAPVVAERILPGQFVMLRLPDTYDPLLGRAFALFDTADDVAGKPTVLEIVYEVVGKMTNRLAGLAAGAQLEIWGPLGNGFPPLPTDQWILVAGGIGITPFVAFARAALGLRRYGGTEHGFPPCRRITLLYGARSADQLVYVDQFRQMGVDVATSTEDGSAGFRGLITDLLVDFLSARLSGPKGNRKGGPGELPGPDVAPQGSNQLPPDCKVLACGPEAMLAKVAEICRQYAVPCWVSLETPMACGMGICFGCAVPVRTGPDSWDYKRTCVDGPIFPAELIAWDMLRPSGH